MKKLIHLGMFAIIAITVSSCSKSTNDLVVNETPGSPKHEMNPILPDDHSHGWSALYPFINQPVTLQLGDPDNYLSVGDIVVFYVLLADDGVVDEASNATLSLMDFYNGGYIQSYPFIRGAEAEAYGVLVPDDLAGKSFMFSVVELDDRYTDKTITLRSDIDLNEMSTAAKLDHAFTVR
jgi:hypothetical protein